MMGIINDIIQISCINLMLLYQHRSLGHQVVRGLVAASGSKQAEEYGG